LDRPKKSLARQAICHEAKLRFARRKTQDTRRQANPRSGWRLASGV